MEYVLNNPEFQHIVEKIFVYLNRDDLLACKLINKSSSHILSNQILFSRLTKFILVEYSVYAGRNQTQRHVFGQISKLNTAFELETKDVRNIQDKFPGLKELFEQDRNVSYLVKIEADLNTNIDPCDSHQSGVFYMKNAMYECSGNITIQCSTKIFSFGKPIISEKVETGTAKYEDGRYVYKIEHPLCEYMVNFIRKMKHLPEKYIMNSVLENFTILYVVTNQDTQEILLCTAFQFEVSPNDHGCQHQFYKLVME